MPDFRATIAIVLFLCSFASHAQLYTVNSGNDPVPRPANDNALNDGKCTFYEALENVNAGADIFEDCPKDKNFIPLTPEIRFSGISKINLLNADPKQSDTPFSIIGNVAKLKIRGPIQFDGNKQTRILVFGGDTALEVEQVHFTDGTSDYEPQMIAPSGAGGCILVNNGGGKLVVKTSEFTGCVAQNGGAIGMGGITLELDNVNFKSNKAVGSAQLQTGQGGAIFGTGKTATVKNTTFESNEATNAGGAWFGASPDAAVTITASKFLNNSATPVLNNAGGGGAFVLGGIVTLNTSRLEKNWSPFPGGAATIIGAASKFTATQSVFDGNYSIGPSVARGGAFASAGEVDVRQCVFKSNLVLGSAMFATGGGAIYAIGGPIAVSNSSFHANAVNGILELGAALYLDDGAVFEVVHNTFEGNIGPSALHVETATVSTVYNNVLQHDPEACSGALGSTVFSGNLQWWGISCPETDTLDPALKGPEIYIDPQSGLPNKWLTAIGMRYYEVTDPAAKSLMTNSAACIDPPVSKVDLFGRARSNCTVGAFE